MWQVHICTKALTSLALRNLIFEDKAFVFTENILKQKKLKQSSPWVSLPLLAGALQALPPRNKSKVLVGSLPAKIRCHRSSPIHRGCTTWWRGAAELPQRG
jgi:hypothetical protein